MINTLIVYYMSTFFKKNLFSRDIINFYGNRNIYIFHLSASNESKYNSLIFKKQDDLAFMYLDENFVKLDNTEWNPGISGYTITQVKNKENDRIIMLDLSKNNLSKQLVIELTGRLGNIILLNSSGVIDTALVPVGDKNNRFRKIIKGVKYEFPPSMDRVCPSLLDDDQINKYLNDFDLAIKETTVRNINFWEKVRTHDGRKSDFIKEPSFYQIIDNEIVPDSFGGFDSINAIIRFVESEEKEDYSSEIKWLKKNIDKKKREIISLNKSLENQASPESFSHIADNLTTYFRKLFKGQKQIELDDIWNPGDKIQITLRENLSPKENINWYYKKAQKAENALVKIPKRIKEIEREIIRLEAYLEKPEKICEIHESKKQNKNVAETPSNKYYRTFEYNNHQILVGKNAKGNDYLTLRVAKPWDIWLHARGVPGSHVVIKLRRDENIQQTLLIEAAKLAAFYSDLRNSTHADIIWTNKKWVQKVRKVPGMVRLLKDKTITIETPKESEIQKLRINNNEY